MKKGQLKLEFESIDRAIRNIKPRVVLLQLPSGLKRRAEEIASQLKRRYKCEVFVSGDSCYGPCDVPVNAATSVDAVVQVGHSPMPSIEFGIPVVFLPVDIELDLAKLLPSAIPNLRSPVGLLAVSQHLGQMKEAKAVLEKKGMKVLIGKGSKRLHAPGQVLGCDYSSARAISGKANSFLLLGGGRFHAIGLKLSTGKPVVILDPERKAAVVEDIDIEKFERKRFVTILALSKADRIGVIVSSKVGQKRMSLAKDLMEMIRQSGKSGRIIVMDELSPERLLDLGYDAYVSTACPRIALDDSGAYEIPLGTPTELMVALSKKKWEDYSIDEWGIYPT